MIISLRNTTTNQVADKLVSIRLEGGVVALSRVLTLLVTVGSAAAEAAIAAANAASMEHPCRLIVLVESDAEAQPGLDAEIRVGGDAGASEVVVLRLGADLAGLQASLVTPLLLPDVPVVTWWPDRVPDRPATTPLGALAERRVTDSGLAPGSLRQRLTGLRDGYSPRDTDLAWTRLTWWRAHLAAVLDQPPFDTVTEVGLVGQTDDPSVVLLAAWLGWKLHCQVRLTCRPDTIGVKRVELRRASGALSIDRVVGTELATLTIPGATPRRFHLTRPSLADCLSEELRRLDEDVVYGEVIDQGLTWLTKHIDATVLGEADR